MIVNFEFFDKNVKRCPNKFKILRWIVDHDKIYLWNLSTKHKFFKQVLHQIKDGHQDFPGYRGGDEMDIIEHIPSIKERAWFMGFFNTGAFL